MRDTHLETELAGIASRLELVERQRLAHVDRRILGQDPEVSRTELDQLTKDVRDLAYGVEKLCDVSTILNTEVEAMKVQIGLIAKKLDQHGGYIEDLSEQLNTEEAEREGLSEAVTLMAVTFGLGHMAKR